MAGRGLQKAYEETQGGGTLRGIPASGIRFDQDSSGNRDRDHGILRIVQIVVGHPRPHVLEIAIGRAVDVQHHSRRYAAGLNRFARRAIGHLEVRSVGAAHSEMRIPHAR